jgi:hypothetical protein
MENALYYTFSTIAQVLAATIALLGIFAIFRVEYLNKRVVQIGKELLRRVNERSFGNEEESTRRTHLQQKLDYAINSLDIPKINESIKEYERLVPNDQTEQLITEPFRNVVEEINTITARTKFSISVSALSIVFSVIILPFVSTVSQCMSYWLFIAGIFIFIVSITLIVFTLITSFRLA